MSKKKESVIKSINIRKDVVEVLELKAKEDNRSVSNYIETVLLDKFGIKNGSNPHH